MAVSLSDSGRALVDGPNFATVVGRKKDRNLRRDPRVSVSIFDIEKPYDYVEVRGRAIVSDEGTAGARALINALSHKYTGSDYTNDGPDDVRVIIRLTPEKVTGTAA